MKNKKLFGTLLLASVLLGSTTLAHASPATSTTKSQKIDKMKAALEKMVNKKATTTPAFIKKVETQRDIFLRNFDVAIRNLDSLSGRVNSLVAKISATGKDVTVLQPALASSTVKIALAKTEYNNLKNLIPQTILAKNRKTILAQIKTQTEKTKNAIKEAHASVVDIINSLRFLRDGEIQTTTIKTIQTSTTTNQ
jgi:hypothetical protein